MRCASCRIARASGSRRGADETRSLTRWLRLFAFRDASRRDRRRARARRTDSEALSDFARRARAMECANAAERGDLDALERLREGDESAWDWRMCPSAPVDAPAAGGGRRLGGNGNGEKVGKENDPVAAAAAAALARADRERGEKRNRAPPARDVIVLD